MKTSRCAAHCHDCHTVNRRQFVSTVSLSTAAILGSSLAPAVNVLGAEASPEPTGPGARYTPKLKACFVRRKGDYGMRWPGQIYDGEAARKTYTQKITEAAKKIGLALDLRPEPIYSDAEADAWLAEAAGQKPDGLLVVLLDRQEHAWPTANKAIDSKIPTVIFSPIGSSFTTNTVEPSKKTGCFISSTDDFSQTEYGMKMLWAGAKIRESRCLVIKGGKRVDGELAQLGLKLRTIPAKTFLEEYEKTPVDDQVRRMAAELIQGARKQTEATEQDVINGIKSYLVAKSLLAREDCDGITMDCLGALGRSKVSLPCIAWSKMNDLGIPAACEADLGAMAGHVLVQHLFDRPGFQQDPVAETVRDAIVGAHCSCATRLAGRNEPPEVYDIVHHHGQRDATARPLWKIGQRVTSIDVLPRGQGQPPQMIISAGEVIDNVSAPPAGGCVVSVMVKFDDVTDVLGYPGFHQLFFYGDFKRELVQYCRLFNIEPVVV